ncbi:hypothetical protein MCHI_002971 [Candidatus Magnetoovum chiemensis]|nr:hypothetical protein MCHI_002971 [Candidatus Magnetoovum chiemensis]
MLLNLQVLLQKLHQQWRSFPLQHHRLPSTAMELLNRLTKHLLKQGKVHQR